jgi:branched-subunit amino acid ABC-type transport system permease component
MTTTITASRTRWYIPSTAAEKAYAAMTGVLLAGFAGVALDRLDSLAPSMNWGIGVVILAAIAMGVGGLLERDTVTTVAAFLGGITGHMVVVTSATDRTYSHRTLAGMFLAVVGALLAVARYVHVRQERTGR